MTERVEAVAEEGGYSTAAELVRAATREEVNRLEKRPSGEKIQSWISQDDHLELEATNTTPAISYDQESGERITDRSLDMLLSAFDIPLYLMQGFQWTPITASIDIPMAFVPDEGKGEFVEAPGYSMYIEDADQADLWSRCVRLEKQFSPVSLSRVDLLNTLLEMASVTHDQVVGEPTMEELLTGSE
ncbi:hypothetical protein [Haloarcula pelagica]|uniref:hypothetical protein n=1 Tax=Haloarcula pelagica TaxID=3033389 RepID=UPI0024C3758F|nr:hypothetical protein [Halomicroarcula sp. YJ-61-S]